MDTGPLLHVIDGQIVRQTRVIERNMQRLLRSIDCKMGIFAVNLDETYLVYGGDKTNCYALGLLRATHTYQIQWATYNAFCILF